MTALDLAWPARPLLPQAWARPLLWWAATAAMLLGLFSADALALLDTAAGSSTYQHILILLPLIGWLVWLRRAELAQLTPRGWWPGLLWLAGGALLWLLGSAGELAVARQLGLAVMLQGSVAAVLGSAVVRAALFPLFALLLAVPMGDELVPALQTLTAQMCMLLLHLFGIPARLDGIFITTPHGYFRVAEACSGAKFLIAMVALGAVAANLCFTSWRRRALWMLACLVVPIAANGVRAFATIAIAEWTGSDFAASFDHVVYGWLFFGLVIALLLGGAWRWFDRDPLAPAVDGARLARSDRGRGAIGLPAAALASVAVALLALGWAVLPDAGARASIPRIAPALPPGWQLVAQPPTGAPWQALYRGASVSATLHLRDGAGVPVDLTLARYDVQHRGADLAGWGQGAAAGEGNGWSWSSDAGAIGRCALDRIETVGPTRRLAVTCLEIGGTVTGSRGEAKLLNLRQRLFGRTSAGAALVASTPEGPGARPRLEALVAAVGRPTRAFAPPPAPR